jgi:hypothetical protein
VDGSCLYKKVMMLRIGEMEDDGEALERKERRGERWGSPGRNSPPDVWG